MALVLPYPNIKDGDVIIGGQLKLNFAAVATEVNGGLTTDSLDANAGIVDTQLAQIATASKVSTSALTGRVAQAVLPLIGQASADITMTDEASHIQDMSLGNVFKMTATSDRTLGTPTNPTANQRIIIKFAASGGARKLTLPTATTGDFRFGEDIIAPTSTTSGKTDYIGCIYNGTASRWDVVAIVKGY